MRDDPVLIIGGPRSGTSLVASAFQAGGLWLGECGGSGGPDNPRGFFENHSMRSLDRALLQAGGFDMFGVDPLPPLGWVHDADAVEKLRADVLAILDAQFCPPDQPWGFKDPKLALTWGAWVAAFPKARIVGVLRRREEMARSCGRARFFTRYTRRALDWDVWCEDMISRVKAIVHALPDSRFVWPDDLARSNERIRPAFADCGLTWSPKAEKLFDPELWSGG